MLIEDLTLIVDETSAYIPGYESLGLCSDHFRMNRYTGPDDPNYRLVIHQLKDMANKGRTFLKREREGISSNFTAIMPSSDEILQHSINPCCSRT